MSSRPLRSLHSPHLRLDFLSAGGPRLVGLYLTGSTENLLAETPDVAWDTPHGVYHLIGGHRLWLAPESFLYTAIPDDLGLGVTEIGDDPGTGLRLTQPPDSTTRISRSIDILLDSTRPALTLTHRLVNVGTQPFTCAAWPITQLPLGGIALLPFFTRNVEPNGLQPNRSLVLWPYTHWNDSRLHICDIGCLLHGISLSAACKIGSFNRSGWLGYFWKDFFFCKHFSHQDNLVYTDQMCNAELFVKDRFVELESLSPLVTIKPGGSYTHVENWEIHRLPNPLDLSASAETLFALADKLISAAL